jgi:ribonucleoside-diphosphate reductase alpha chain
MSVVLETIGLVPIKSVSTQRSAGGPAVGLGRPLMTEDTWVMTAEGPRRIRDLFSREFFGLVDGKALTTKHRVFSHAVASPETFDVTTREGWSLRVAGDSLLRTVGRGWVNPETLEPGEKIVLHDHLGAVWSGRGDAAEGYLLGHLWGDGTLKTNLAVLSVWGDDTYPVRTHLNELANQLPHRSDWRGFRKVAGRGEWRLNSTSLAALAGTYGMSRGNKKITDEIEKASSNFYEGFLCAAFDTDGGVEGGLEKGLSVRLHQSDLEQLQRIQRMLGRLGIISKIHATRASRTGTMPDGRGGKTHYASKASWRLIIANQYAARSMERIGFIDTTKTAKWARLDSRRKKARYTKSAEATFNGLASAGRAEVYGVTGDLVQALDANGLYAT